MEKRSVIRIDPVRDGFDSDDSLESMLERSLQFVCGLEVESIVNEGSEYKVYLFSTGYDEKFVKKNLSNMDFISSIDIVV